ncbi:metallophosphoesterase [Salibacterium aidingense]|uniref:metallophosphoesterase n=1 Tax=Salibacterium aidingense TaxID=384933 RepID=UPI003BDCBA93
MENGSIPGWQTGSITGPSVVERSEQQSARGTYSMYYNDQDNSGSLNVESEKVSVEAGDPYFISAEVFRVYQSHRLAMDVRFYDEEEKEIVREREFFGAEDLMEESWTTVSQFVEAPEDAAYATLGFYSGGISNTEVYLDDVFIERSSEEDLAMEITAEGLFKREGSEIRVTNEAGQSLPGAEVFVGKTDKEVASVPDGETVPLYDEPDVSSDEIDTVSQDTLLPILEKSEDGWVRVELPNETIGWMQRKDLTIEAWGQPLGVTNENGVLETEQLTLFGGEVELHAVYDGRTSDEFSFPIYDEHGTREPENLVLTSAQDPATTAAFTWRTHPDVRQTVVEVVPEGNAFDGDEVVQGKGSNFSFDTNIGEMRLHEAEVDKLQPDTSYQYQVGSGTEGEWSETGRFQTAPDAKEDFQFLFATDTQAPSEAGYSLWTETLREAAESYPDAAFTLFGGDMVNNGDNQTEWDYWFEAGTPYLKDMRLYPLPGNHEAVGNGMEYYDAQFQLPENGPGGETERAYSFDYSNTHIAVLNSEGDLAAQALWLREDLENSDKTWNIVVTHRSPYHTHPTRSNEGVRDVLEPVFHETGVDLVLAGHDHAYSRTWPMKDGRIVQPEEGVPYVIGGTTGPKFYPVGDYEYIRELTEEEQIYTGITIEGRTLTLEAVTKNGDTVDTFTLDKDSSDNGEEGLSFENEGFEEKETDKIQGWTKVDTHEDSILERSETNARTGEASLHFLDGTEEATLRLESSPVDVEAGQSYLIESQVYKISQSHSVVTEIQYFNEAGEMVDSDIKLSRDADLPAETWQPVSMLAEVPDDAAYLKYYFHSGGISKTEMYVDDTAIHSMADHSTLLNRTMMEPKPVPEKVEKVKEAIRNLPDPGEVTVEDEKQIRRAGEMFEELTIEQRMFVTNERRLIEGRNVLEENKASRNK